jgi:hypothetical protein
MLDLARGRLNDVAALEAEAIRRSCGACASWWSTHLEGPAVAELDQQVEGAFAAFEAPARRRFSDKLPWAVAAVLALGVGIVLQPGETVDPQVNAAAEPASLLVREQFNTDTNGDGSIDLSDVTIVVSTGMRQSDSAAETLFGSDLESGDLSVWSGARGAERSGESS